MNNTIVQFYTRVENGAHSTFDGTAFAALFIEFLRCVVGGTVFGLKSGPKWLKRNLNLRLLHVAPDVLTLGAGNVSELANLVSAAAMLSGDGSGNGIAADESRIMLRAFESYRIVLKGEVYMFSVFLGAYALVAPSTIVIMLVKSRNASPAPSAER